MVISCPTCNGRLEPGLRDWHRVCRTCSYEGSVLQARILEQVPGGELDEFAREDALEPLRRRNFAHLSGLIREACPHPAAAGKPRLLDVGCAHGWFLEQNRADFDVTGIEPDVAVADATRRRGLHVRAGFFPDAMKADERFDVIVFNDVLEHIPDVHATLAACRRHLLPGGLLVINSPDRRGALYRISKLLLRVGAPAYFDRMWQEGFPSPHVHYFDSSSLVTMLRSHGFSEIGMHRLASLSTSGLYARVSYSRAVPAWKAMAITALVTAAIPALRLMPSDITVWLFRQGADAGNRGGSPKTGGTG